MVFVIYIFGGKIWGFNKNFRGKIWGQAPHFLIWKYPPGDNREKNTNVCVTSAEPEFTLNHEGFKGFPWEYSHLNTPELLAKEKQESLSSNINIYGKNW